MSNFTDNPLPFGLTKHHPDSLQESSFFTTSLLLLALLVLLALNRSTNLQQKRLPRLAGLPWIGRVWDLPSSGSVVDLARHFSRFHKQHGPLFEWHAFGATRIFINDENVAHDMLVLNGKDFSDRPELGAVVGMKGQSFLPLMGIGEKFSKHRNFAMAMMRDARLNGFYSHISNETVNTLHRMMRSSDWSQNIIIHCARSATLCAWGSTSQVDTLLEIVPSLLKCVSPGGPLPNQMPFLCEIPFVLSPWKQREAEREAVVNATFKSAWSDALQQDTRSWARYWTETKEDTRSPAHKIGEAEAVHAVGTCAFVAIATIGSPLHAFFTAMAFHPSWMSKLQAEIDEICGDRLPSMQDLPRLKTLRAVVKEVMRWRPSIPMGVPHSAAVDTVYNSYHIPKGTIIFVNQLAISRNETRFPQAEDFRPERWLEPSWPTYQEPLTKYPDIRDDPAFGQGIRACPGVELVREELYTLIAGIAWLFDIRRREGCDGQVPWRAATPWIISTMHSFPVDMQVRSKRRAQLIEDLYRCDDKPSKFSGDGFNDWQGLAVSAEIMH